MFPFRSNHPRSASSGLALVMLVAALTALAACRPEPSEVETASMTEGEQLAEADADGGEVAVMQGGPAAWSCQRYLDFSDETSQHFDAESAEAAETFADDMFRAAEVDEGGALVRPEVDVRTAMRSACAERQDITLADALREAYGEGAE